MRDVDIGTITGAATANMGAETDPRLRQLLAGLIRHVHDFARENRITHDEWRRAIQLFTEAGKITTEERNEFVLLSDVMGLSSLVDMINSAPEGTPSSVLGPFHVPGAPALAVGGDMRGGLAGEALIVSGYVRDAAGRPIPGAALEVWQTAPHGLYSNQDPAMDPFALRMRMTARADGRYAFVTTRPTAYTIPTDGPVGDIFRAIGRHPWRPAHLHFIVMAEGFRTLVTEVFPSDDRYIDEDAVFGVRRALCLPFVRRESAADLPPEISTPLEPPFLTVEFDIALARAD